MITTLIISYYLFLDNINDNKMHNRQYNNSTYFLIEKRSFHSSNFFNT